MWPQGLCDVQIATAEGVGFGAGERAPPGGLGSSWVWQDQAGGKPCPQTPGSLVSPSSCVGPFPVSTARSCLLGAGG